MNSAALAPDPESPEPRRRRFTLADLMIIVAASGIAVAWIMANLADRGNIRPGDEGNLVVALHRNMPIILPVLVMASVATFAMHLMPPRTGRSKGRSGAGAVACGTVVLFSCLVAVAGAFGLALRLAGDQRTIVGGRLTLFRVTWHFHTVGFAIAAAWLALLANDRLRSGPIWTERAGMVLGLVWIVFSVVYKAYLFAI